MPLAARARSLLAFIAISVCAGLLIAVAVAPVAAAAGASTSGAVQFFDDLPSYLRIGTPQDASTIYATKDGQQVPIATFYSEDRDVVASSDISDLLRSAAVDTEDPRYYSEGGVDVTGTIRALLVDGSGGQSTQGGSSITQQYVKNVLVQQCEQLGSTATIAACYSRVTGATVSRKLQELRYAVAVNKKYSKADILTGYLNIVGLGGNVYGAQAAAEYYFGTSAKDVTLAQAATLVAILNNPSNLRIDEPTNSANGTANGYALTKARRNYVLQRMETAGSITKAQETAAAATPITPRITATNEGCTAAATNYDAGYFCDYVRDEVLHDSAFGATEEDRIEALDTEGLDIHTTLDLDLQAQAQSALSSYVPTTSAGVDLGGANVTVQPGTGQILSMVQNTAYTASGSVSAGTTGVNYNSDEGYGGSTGFATGSTFKAFTLAEWLATGHTLSEYVTSNQHSFPFSEFTNSSEDIGSGTWNVANDTSFSGSYSVLDATAQSINTVFAQMGTQLDLGKIADLAESMGIHRADGTALREYPSMILGVNELSPLDLASAYAGFSDGGVVCTPVAIKSVTTSSGSSITPTGTSCTQGVSAAVAGSVADALQSVLTGDGTAASANPEDGVAKFAKTGTTDSDVQNWLVASTTKYTNATWIGNAEGQVGLEYYPLLQGTTGYSAKFGVGRQLMTYLDQAYGGGALPAPDPAMVGSGYSSGVGGSTSTGATYGSTGAGSTEAGTVG